MKERFKIHPDYASTPFIGLDKSNRGPIEPESLPLQKETIENLNDWIDRYDITLNMEDPASSGFTSKEEELIWKKDGISLWKQLQKELEVNYQIFYYDDNLKTLFDSPQQFEETLGLK